MTETFGQRVRRDRGALNWSIYDLATTDVTEGWCAWRAELADFVGEAVA